MNILILNGSPKGNNSVTLQTLIYLAKLNPQHKFRVLHVGQKIKSLEKNLGYALKAMQEADLLIFSYPVYTFLAPSQLHRFIELVKESGVDLSGKFATQFTTSKHFYDITAHAYIRDNCFDLGLKYIQGLSADMDDLTVSKGQQQARDFFAYVCWSVEHNSFEPIPAPAAPASHCPVSVPVCEADKDGDVVIVTDCRAEDAQLGAMIARFRAVLPRKTRVVNIREYPFRGGCLGCFNCAITGKCIYSDKFDSYLRSEIQTAQSIVYAFAVSDHSMGSRFKMYDDRNFCNGHRTVTIGMPVGYLVSGNLAGEENLRNIMEARAQVGSNFLAGVATDQVDPDGQIDRLAKTLVYALENSYVPPQNFYGIGGMKVFRDLIWLMQGMMRADHQFYKEHGQYDFPQKQWPKMLAMYAVGELLANPALKKKAGGAMTEGMLMPYKKVLEGLDKK